MVTRLSVVSIPAGTMGLTVVEARRPSSEAQYHRESARGPQSFSSRTCVFSLPLEMGNRSWNDTVFRFHPAVAKTSIKNETTERPTPVKPEFQVCLLVPPL